MLSPGMLLPWFPVSVENKDLGDGLELCSMQSDSRGFVRWTLEACG
jgi:hypothetical protein